MSLGLGLFIAFVFFVCVALAKKKASSAKRTQPKIKRELSGVVKPKPELILDLQPKKIKTPLKINKLEKVFKKVEGIPYVWGGNTPEEGLDCSGFILYMLRNIYDETLNDLKDMTASGIYKYFKIEKNWITVENNTDKTKKGDLVFWADRKSAIYHIGVVLDNTTFYEAGVGGYKQARKLLTKEISQKLTNGRARVKAGKFKYRKKPTYTLRRINE